MIFILLILLLFVVISISRRQKNLFIITCILSFIIIGFLLMSPEMKIRSGEDISIGEISEATEELFIHYIDVGQADAIFIDYGDYEILIDGGNNADGDLVVEYLKPYTEKLELVIATHPHEDHIGGLDDVFLYYDVLEVIDSGYDYDTKTYRDYHEALLLEGANYYEDSNMTIKVDEYFEVQIIESGDNYKNTNDNSVIVKIVYMDTSFLFTGDMEEDSEDSILVYDIKADVLKASHHGSKTSSTKEFLDIGNPDIIIVSVGENNKYGHPHESTIARFFEYTTDVFLTSKEGTIILMSDGKIIKKVSKP